MKLKLPDGPFKAYLFDCDGTIVDSMPLHYVAWKKVLSQWDCEFGEELFYSWGGMPVAEIIAALNLRSGLAMPSLFASAMTLSIPVAMPTRTVAAFLDFTRANRAGMKPS